MVVVFLPVLPVGVVLWLSSRDVTRLSYVAVGTKKLKEGPARGLGMLLCVPHWRAPHRAVFREFCGQVMGITGDYVDSIFEHSIYLQPPDSPVGYDPIIKPTMSLGKMMLPVPKDGITSQECVEGSLNDKATDGTKAEVVGGEAPIPPAEVIGEGRAPLLQVRGQPWSPGVYRLLRLLGRPLEVAWKRAFISLPTF